MSEKIRRMLHKFASALSPPSQAAQLGLAVSMASAIEVLKHETSTIRQSHNLISIDFTFGVGNYVREVTSPAKFCFFVFYSSTELQPVDRFHAQ